jgi:hypothetical protein
MAAAACGAAPGPGSTAGRNPLYPVPGGQFQDKQGDLSAAAAARPDDGPDLRNAHAGDWAVYRGFDFDSGVAAFKASVAAPGGAKITVRLDRPDGPVLGTLTVGKTGGAERFRDVTCPVDHSQAAVRDVYLVFDDAPSGASVRSFVFLKSVQGKGPVPDLSGRLDKADDGEPQATRAWGMPEAGFTDDFADLSHWKGTGFSVANGAVVAKGDASAFTPDVYINKTDTGGEWRTLAEASLTVDVTADGSSARPAVGFSSADGKQCVYVVLNAGGDALQAYRHLADGSTALVQVHPKNPSDPSRDFHLAVGQAYKMRLAWSPYSDALITFLSDGAGKPLTSFRTAIDLPAARRPMLANRGGSAHFAHLAFDPKLDGWNYRWQWFKQPVVPLKDVCNPAVWKWSDGKYYMVWRKFGADTFHGISTSDDAIHWTTVTEKVMKCTGDMNVLVDPFGDGKVWCTPGNANMPWFTSDGADRFSDWKPSGKTTGDLHNHNRIQEVIDTAKHKQMSPVEFEGRRYRFVAFVEDWTHVPKPHTSVMLSNTLTEWTLADPGAPVLPPRDDFWGEKGSAIGSATVLPDGNILLASCSCTNEGYTGAPEPTNISVIVDGKQPWKILELATLPDAPVSRENVWYQGPNFGTAFLYEPKDDTLYFYGGFHDYAIGMMRVQGFLHGNK